MPPGQKPKLKRPVEEVRAELLASKETQHLAEVFGMKLEDYVEKVLDYAQNPDKEPMLTVATDEAALKAAHPEVMTTAETVRELEKLISGETTLNIPGEISDGFEDSKKMKVEISAKYPAVGSQTGAPTPSGSHPQIKKGQTPKG